MSGAPRAAGDQLAGARAGRRVRILLSDCRATDGEDPLASARGLGELMVLAPADDCVEAAAFAASVGARWNRWPERPTRPPHWLGCSTDDPRLGTVDGMYGIAEQVLAWLAAGKAVHVAQLVATRGFSSSDPSAALAWTDDGESVGALLPGMDADLAHVGSRLDGRLAEFAVSDADAVAAGLSCGGVATVLVQNAAAYPGAFWARVHRRESLCVLSDMAGDSPGRTEVYTRADVRDAARRPGAEDVPRLFARGASATALITVGDSSLAVVTLWPPTRLLVVGDGTIADALADLAALLGWASTVTNAPSDVFASLTESDAVVVLSHDRDVDVPALAAALVGRAGYVGALGSRPTQAARREGLAGRGIEPDDVARIHGPAGLDLDARTPGEIAVSIVAEILADRSGSSARSISGRPGPVHVSGVNAPPPRS